MAFDTFGWETGNRQHSAVDVPHDPIRLNYIKALADAGHADRLLIGGRPRAPALATQTRRTRLGAHT